MKYPRSLAKYVFDRWPHLVAGEYTPPPCPPQKMLSHLMELAFHAANIPDEARFPRFNLVATPKSGDKPKSGQGWPFTEPRKLTIAELRGLAAATDLKKSAIWLTWDDKGWEIAGVIDLGTSWHRARMGLEYDYEEPSNLFIQMDRPGRMRVYQGGFHIATLADGDLKESRIDFHLSLHPVANAALELLGGKINRPKFEYVREWAEFEFMALWNTYIAIANSISQAGHGGMVIIAPPNSTPTSTELRVKYAHDVATLGDSFVEFMNARHKFGDLMARKENGEAITPRRFGAANSVLRRNHDALIESTRFVAGLSGCDGAIFISADLRLLGFGVEIRSELREGTKVFDVIEEMRRVHRPLDVEQFGMRHRSAVKLVSQMPDYRCLVVSQDGPISAVWSDKDEIFVRKGVHLINMNMPLG